MRKLRRFAALALTLLLLLPALQEGSAAVLAMGSRGEKVVLIQQALKKWGYLTGEVDGNFGRATYNAVVSFQRKNGLTVDGRVGASTSAALGLNLSGSALSASLYRDTELSLLSRLVSGEARGEPYVGQVAVAAVVLNRVRDSAFPNTVSGVIFQTGAFDAVWDGQFDMPPTESSIRAARDALNGWDPTGGCLYYYNPRTAVDDWIRSRVTKTVIGRHEFAM